MFTSCKDIEYLMYNVVLIFIEYLIDNNKVIIPTNPGINNSNKPQKNTEQENNKDSSAGVLDKLKALAMVFISSFIAMSKAQSPKKDSIPQMVIDIEEIIMADAKDGRRTE